MKDEIKEIHNELEKENKVPTMNNIREKLGLDRIENNNKDEIKEKFYSLEELKRTIDCYDGYLDNEEVYYFIGALRFAYDYITNLQTIEREYSSLLSENAELENKITNLQEENERLKIQVSTKEKECMKLQEIINKAIEYINYSKFVEYEHFVCSCSEGNCCPEDEIEELLNILEGINNMTQVELKEKIIELDNKITYMRGDELYQIVKLKERCKSKLQGKSDE